MGFIPIFFISMETKKTIILYDNWCGLCTNFARVCQQLDWFNALSFRELRNSAEQEKFPLLNVKLATEQIASVKNGIWKYGFDSLLRIFLKIPLFWIFIPLIFLLKITGLGQFLYYQLAVSRKIIPLHCHLKDCSAEKKSH